ncbi:MAG: sulfatase [Dehalococcoidia bacterium]|nr:sulfatase [Dehalococcoidia bacterium]
MNMKTIRERLARFRSIVKAVHWLRQRRDHVRNEIRYRHTRKRIALDAPVRNAKDHDFNVVIIVVDSLRYDALSGNGYFRQTTPFLDTFDCRLKAISASPWTYPSVPSILTGLYPHNHGAFLSGKVKNMGRPDTYLKIRDHVLTLPEILRFFDYYILFSTGISHGYWYKYRTAVLPRQYTPATPADKMLGDLGRWIENRKGHRFFAYVHLADLHPPMRPPEDFRHFFSPIKDLPKIDAFDFFTEAQRRANPEAFEEYRHHRRALYDNSLRYVDSAIETFHRKLTGLGVADSTILIVTADHGEQFWEHADPSARHFKLVGGFSGLSHGDMPYYETIEVPLLLRGPVPSCRGNHLASTTDIVPTILDLLTISHPWQLDGQSVFTAAEHRPLLSEGCSLGHEKKSLTVGRYRLLYSKDDGIQWLFDLEKDPQEQRPISDEAVTSVFVKRLLAMLERDERRRALETVRRTTRRKVQTT